MFVTGTLIIDAETAALNNAGTDSENVLRVKKAYRGQRAYPYVSGQAFRRALRDTINHGALSAAVGPASPVTAIVGKKEDSKQIITGADPYSFWDDDLCGFMRATKDDNLSRRSPFLVGSPTAMRGDGVVRDGLTMSRDLDMAGSGGLFEHEVYAAELRAAFSLNLAEAGVFFNRKSTGFANVSKELALILERDSSLDYNDAQLAWILPAEKRLARIATLFHGIAQMHGGAKGATNYSPIRPEIVVFGVQTGGNHLLRRALTVDTVKDGDRDREIIIFSPETVQAFLDAEQRQSPLYIGWDPGYLVPQRKEAAEWAKKAGDEVVIGSVQEAVDRFVADLNANPGWLAV